MINSANSISVSQSKHTEKENVSHTRNIDAGDYGMFISNTWTDEETNEEKTRMGVRYSELLAFIIAAI